MERPEEVEEAGNPILGLEEEEVAIGKWGSGPVRALSSPTGGGRGAHGRRGGHGVGGGRGVAGVGRGSLNLAPGGLGHGSEAARGGVAPGGGGHGSTLGAGPLRQKFKHRAIVWAH
ncbi:glycine-rich protein DOT1 [Selaginella moellendorffii]|uniref:glycine-rich protein DOT1 n=1 Tax=Selaginella moellendorffii TaxID=88036 RepID=UPI000D1C9D51|nr:glycine-rich protein DOT1 [Selaginella moellendorffii]|eukprot:XP_024536126.1 glycine-rich protein DOT1 [Selaginella moellendorffii]